MSFEWLIIGGGEHIARTVRRRSWNSVIPAALMPGADS